MMEELLKKLELKEKEIKIYLAALKARKATPAEIAKVTRINRATVYSIAKTLISKGMLIEDLGGKTLYLLPTPPAELKRFLKKEEEALKEKERLVNRIVSELSLLSVDAKYPVPKIRFVEEENLEDHLYKQGKIWNESALRAGGIWWGFQDHSFVERYKDWLNWIWKNSPEEIYVKLLSNQSEIEKRVQGKFKRREIRFWGKADSFTATTWVIGDYLVLISTAQKPYFLVEIHDPLLAHNMREVFKNLWPLVR